MLWLSFIALLAIVAAMAILRTADPPTTPTLAVRKFLGEPVEQRWVPLDMISPELVRAVIASEDGKFCRHYGIDFGELKAAIDSSLRGNPRGASTISMQVVKNMFLWPHKSVVRKVLELPLTLVLELIWSKRRIMEVYLNIAEWGPGIYGAEAAARYHFDTPAEELTRTEAALLAASLPNPIARFAGEPEPQLSRLAKRLSERMRNAVNTSCLGE